MRAFIRNTIQARRNESGEKGFSLIELIIVVAILGVLAAVAIPLFMNIQGQAEQSVQDTVAANAASQAAVAIASNDPNVGDFGNLENGGKYTIVNVVKGATPDADTVANLTSASSIGSICIKVTGGTATPSYAGPACG